MDNGGATQLFSLAQFTEKVLTASVPGHALHELNREEVQRLVSRATADGPGALTEAEKEFLDRMSAG